MPRARLYLWRTTWSRWFANPYATDRALIRKHNDAFLLQACIFAVSAGYFGSSLDPRELSSVAFLSAPSVLFCALSVVVVFSLTERVAGTIAALLAAFFLATNPEVVDAARSLRLYSLFILCSASCVWFGHAYLARSRHPRHLLGFASSLVIAICTNFVRGQHSPDSRISAAPTKFLVTVARTLFLGDLEGTLPLRNYFLLAPLTLFALGIFVLRKRGSAIAAAIFLATLLGAWLLNRASHVEARDLCFLTPAIAIFMGVGAVRSPKAQYFAPLIVTVFWLCHFATERAYSWTQ